MKKKTIQPRIGKDRKYLSIFKEEVRSWSSAGPDDFQKDLHAHFDLTHPNLQKIIASYEKLALFIIENEGHYIKKPYKFRDKYEIKNGFHEIVEKIKTEIETEDWSMTYAGRAAKILEYCHQLRSSMEGGNIGNTARFAMLLQKKIDFLSFMSADLPANIGQRQRLIGSQGKYSYEDQGRMVN